MSRHNTERCSSPVLLKVRIAAVAHGSLAVAGGIMAIDDAPTEGLHCTVDGATLGDIEVPDNGEGGEWCPDDFICPITLEELKDPPGRI